MNKIRANRLTLLLAGSGVGKSSLLRAGIMPKLRKDSNIELIYYRDWASSPQAFKQAVSAHYDEPHKEKAPLKSILRACTLFSSGQQIILLDQFEEFFNYQRFKEEFWPFVEELSEAVLDRRIPASFVFSMREDFALELNAFKKFLPGVFDNYFRLEKLTRAQARLAIAEPLKQTGYSFAPQEDGKEALLDQVLDDLAKREQEKQFGVQELLERKELPLLVEPPHLQIVCRELWLHHRDDEVKQITHAAYEQARGTNGILESYFLRKIKSFSSKEQALASAAFDHLIGQRATKVAHSLERLAELTRADASLLRLLLKQLEKVERIWEQHFHDDTKELFGWDEENEGFISQLSVKIQKHIQLDVGLLKTVLDKLQDCAVLRRQKRDEDFWYELYHDIFSESIDRWNREFKTWQRLKRFALGGVAVLVAGGMLFAGNNWRVNYYGRYLTSNEGVFNRIEIHQGREKENNLDLFNLGKFRYESPFLRQDLEADKRLDHSIVEDRENTQANLLGRLPILDRLPHYARNGLYGKIDELAENILASKEKDLINSFPDQLAELRTAKSSALLADERQAKKKVIAAFVSLGDNSSLVKFLADKDSGVRRDAVKALGMLGDSSVTPELVKLLADEDLYVRLDVVVVLDSLGDISGLVKFLADENTLVRSYVADALSRLGDISVAPELVRLFSDEDEDAGVRRTATKALGNLGDSSVVPELIKRLADEDSYVRQTAAEALGRLGDISVAPELVRLLSDEDADVRKTAAEGLGRLGDSSVAPELIKLLADEAGYVRETALEALSNLGDSSVAPELVRLLSDEDADVRKTAAEGLGRLGDSSVVPKLVKLLADGYVRETAVEALGRLGDSSVAPELVKLLVADELSYIRHTVVEALDTLGDSSVVPELVRLLAEEDAYVRRDAVKALGRLGDSSVAPELVRLLSDEDTDVRRTTAKALGRLGDISVAPELVRLLSDEDTDVRRTTAKALGRLGDGLIVPELVKLLADENVNLRRFATGTLGSLGDNSVAPELIKLLADEDSEVRGGVAGALGRLGYSSAAPELVRLLADEDAYVRYTAVEVLDSLGDSSVVPELVRLLAEEDAYVRYTAVEALGRLGDSSVAPELVKRLTDEDVYVRRDAVKALGRLGDSSVAPELVKRLTDEDADVRQKVAVALGKLGDSSVVPELVKRLADEEQYMRVYAAKALGMLGDSSATPELVKLLADESNYVQRDAVVALGRLGDSSVAPELVSLLTYEDADVRGAAAEALGNLGDSSIAPELMNLLVDENEGAWQAAAEALSRLKVDTVDAILHRYLKDTKLREKLRDDVAKMLIRKNVSSPELRFWQEGQFKITQENVSQYVSQYAASSLGFVFTEESVTLLSSMLADVDQEVVVKAAIKSLGSIGEYHPGLVSAQAEQLLKLTGHKNFELKQAAITALGQLISFHGKEKPADLPELDKKVYPILREFFSDSQEKIFIRFAALDALGTTGRQEYAKEIYELLRKLDKGKDELLRHRSLLWLGRMAYTGAHDYIEEELEDLEQEKAEWRKKRDIKEPEKATSPNEVEVERQDKTWKKEHWEYMLGNALARIKPKITGIDLLNHPLYQVRQGAIRALASRIADGTADAALIGKIIQAHQAFDPDDLPSPFPYAAFRAIDLALWNLEYAGTKKGISILQDILKNLKPCQVPGQEGAIKERLEWTIDRLEQKLKPQAEKENRPASS
ncbi:MAG: HEAT repeat domain-containing protein [Planctomycetes bacterium]|nr:HEAT repeat domain-containing protein [Planctomycetota bacterium]